MFNRRAFYAAASGVLFVVSGAASLSAAIGEPVDRVVQRPPFSSQQVTYTCDNPIRIMPMGDSITIGSGTTPEVGYRQPLNLQLAAAGYSVDFVGSLSTGDTATPSFDTQHEAYSGYTDDDVAANVAGWLTANPADIVLLHIGTNDIGVDPGAADIEQILTAIDGVSTDIKVILAQIVNRQTYSAETHQFNLDMAAMVSDRITAGDDIVLVDMESALTYPDDMANLLHPNATGYGKMAAVWYSALAGVLPVCLPTQTPTLTPTPTETPTVTPSITPASVAALFDVNCLTSAYLEAETATLLGGFSIEADAAASGGQYIVVPQGYGNRTLIDTNEKATFQFNVTEAGVYQIAGWVYAASGNDDSFYVTVDGLPVEGYDWFVLPNINYDKDYVNDQSGADPVEVNLDVGSHTVAVYLREDGTRLDRIGLEPNCVVLTPTVTPTSTPTSTPAPIPDVSCTTTGYLEAEGGVLNGGFEIGADAAASGGQYIVVPEGYGIQESIVGNSDTATYQFNVTEEGTYWLSGWVYAATGNDDSFFVTVDDLPTAGYLWDLLVNTSYSQDYLADRGIADPVVLSLGTGLHTVIFYLRDDAARLDRIALEPHCPPILPAVTTTVENEDDIRLSWTHISPNTYYEMWLSPFPYSSLTNPEDVLLTTLNPTSYGELLSVVYTAGQVSPPDFFYLKAFSTTGGVSSPAWGRFTFVVVPGS